MPAVQLDFIYIFVGKSMSLVFDHELELKVKQLMRAMLVRILMHLMMICSTSAADSFVDQDGHGFKFEGFHGANLSMDGMAEVTSDGLLRLTNTTSVNQIGHAFFSTPFPFLATSGDGNSFSTMFAIALVPLLPRFGGNGIAFVISSTDNLVGAQPGGYLSLMNSTTMGNSSNHIVAVEFDTVQNVEFKDVDNNHVGIDVNSLVSNSSAPTAYYSNKDGKLVNLSLSTGEPLLVWVDYNGTQKQLNVTISPIDVPKPSRPLLISSNLDLSSLFLNNMYVGFSAATNAMLTSHYVLGWSFSLNREAVPLNLRDLPALPRSKEAPKLLTIGLPVLLPVMFLGVVICVVLFVIRKIKYAEVIEDWEIEYGPQRFSYKDLHKATSGFKEKNLLGQGGFGKVYKATMPRTNALVAVKRISHNSEQGMRQFVAEIASIGRIRHPGLVRLQGYCRRKKELLLVYDLMVNGSLNKYLYSDANSPPLIWSHRFRILKQVASGLLFLHEQWNQVVLHRDIKPSNVLLDRKFNGKLGDFGLSRLYDRGSDPQTTRLVGTIGYIAPEIHRTGKMSRATDVYAFGIFMLEVACGRRPMEPNETSDRVFLAEWVMKCLGNGRIMHAADYRLRSDFVREEMELVLKLGLVCSQNSDSDRSSMGKVVQFLNRERPLSEVSIDDHIDRLRSREMHKASDGLSASFTSFETVSILFSGR